jgi:hypothetical protein
LPLPPPLPPKNTFASTYQASGTQVLLLPHAATAAAGKYMCDGFFIEQLKRRHFHRRCRPLVPPPPPIFVSTF